MDGRNVIIEPVKGIGKAIFSRVSRRAFAMLKRKFNITDDTSRNIKSILSLFGESEDGFPTEFFGIGASMWSGYLFTPLAEQQMSGWVFPYWLRRQTDPSSPSFVPHSHAYFYANKTHRNWTGLGLSGFPHEGSVDDHGLITPWPFGPSLDVWVMAGDELICPSEVEDVKQELIDNLPLVRTYFETDKFSFEIISFMGAPDDTPVLIGIAEVENALSNSIDLAIVISLRPYNTESLSAVNRIRYRPGDRCFDADGAPILYLVEPPGEVILSNYEHGDVAQLLRHRGRRRPPSWAIEIEDPRGLATAAAVYHFDAKPGERKSVCFASPVPAGFKPPFAAIMPGSRGKEVAREQLEIQKENWRELLCEGVTLEIPDREYERAFSINKAYLLLLYDGQCITPGVSIYHMMWFRDAAYLVPALERTGNLEMAKGILLTYPDRQREDGFFKSHSGEWDSNGQAIWTLVNHFRMTDDLEFLKKVYPSIAKGARWIDEKRQLDLEPTDPRYGILPPGISAEHFGLNDCYYWDDLWAVGGLKAAALAARTLGFERDEAYFTRLAEEITDALLYSWEQASERLGEDVIPIAPGRDFDSGSIGILCAVYPLEIIRPDNPLMENTVKKIVEKCFYKDAHFHGIFHCGLNAYLSTHVAQYYMRRRDPYCLRIFESLLSMATDTLTFPEAINPLTGGGAFGDGHHGWAVADLFNFERNLFVFEEGEKLVILPVPKAGWFVDGKKIELRGAPTYFGTVSYSVETAGNLVTFNLDCAFRRLPEKIELNVPYPVSSAELDGAELEVARGTTRIEVPPRARLIRLQIERG